MTLNNGWKKMLVLSVSVVLFAASSCDDDDEDEIKTQYNISGNATGAQEVPPVNTPATGTLTGTYNSATNVLTYSISWTGLTGAPTMMHFHGPAGVGEINSPIVHITGYPQQTTGTVSGTANVEESMEQDLLNERWYYNLHTPTHGGGEIRAQVLID